MELLAVKNLSPMEVSPFVALLESCEIARYSPATDVKMQQDFDQALKVISNIDKIVAKRSHNPRMYNIKFVVVLIMLPIPINGITHRVSNYIF